MERRFLKALLFAAAAACCLLLSSCGEFGASAQVFLGNYAFFRGDYQKANIRYLRAEESGVQEQIIAYNLGTVYQALGETESAMDQWSRIDAGENTVLAYRAVFSRGVLQYQLGEYQKAYDLFRQALIYNPASLEAKINLEYAFRKLNIKEQALPAASSGVPQAEPGKEEIQRIMEYIRRTELVRPAGDSPGENGAGGQDW